MHNPVASEHRHLGDLRAPFVTYTYLPVTALGIELRRADNNRLVVAVDIEQYSGRIDVATHRTHIDAVLVFKTMGDQRICTGELTGCEILAAPTFVGIGREQMPHLTGLVAFVCRHRHRREAFDILTFDLVDRLLKTLQCG